ncbi:TonB-dependent receptor [Sphingomonadaceae bacterium jetA1]|uniref:TonB-dependent receptor n=1 Tax=Facivitalis istanbulensis TaxID=3075838 RepID=UPI003498EAE5
MAMPTRVQAAPADRTVRFAIPAQNLAAALDVLARQSGMQILYPYRIAVKRQGRPLHRAMAVRAALRHLIADSGLEIAFASDRVIILRASPVAAPVRLAERRAAPRRPAMRAPASPVPPAAPTPTPDIVVTGRAAATPVGDTELSYAVTRIDPLALNRKGPVSTANLFKDIPGFWVESTGGEASNNVRSRGIPTDGYSSVALIEDGLPVQYDGGLGYQNTDQVFRIDPTIRRVEAVRGGPSAIFMANAPGGSVNFLTRDALRDPGYTLSGTLGSFAYRRIDGYAGVRVTPSLGLSLGGFYRRDRGLRDPGFPADRGGQFRVGVDYRRGALDLRFNVKHLDDRVILYLPVPLRLDATGKVDAIPGFDPLRDTLAGPDEVHVPFKTAQGPRDFDLSEGTHSRITFYTITGRWAFAADSALEVKARLRTGSTLRNGLFPIGRPMTQDGYVASIWPQIAAAFPSAATAIMRYADRGADRGTYPGADPGPALPIDSNGNGLVTGGNLLSVTMPMRELIADARLTHAFDLGGHHDLAAGMTYDDTRMGFRRTMGTVLLDVRGQARRLDVIAVDGEGRTVGALTDNGFVRYGSLFDNATLRPTSLAAYLADEWKLAPRWRLDLGTRWERVRIGGGVEQSQAVDLGDPATLADNAVLTGTGLVLPIRRRYSGFNATIGTNFSPSRDTGLFARLTRIARLPSASEFTANPDRTDEAAIPIIMAEAGLILHRPRWNVSAVGFRTRFSRLPFTDHRFDPVSNAYIDQTEIASTTTWGLEVAGHAKLIGPLGADLIATWQDPRYRDFRFVDLVAGRPVTHDYSGNQLIRVPRLSFRVTPSLDLLAGTLRIAAEFSHYSARYADIANTQRLPPFSMVNLTINATPADRVTFALQVDNLTNTLGLTEGNPRAGAFDAGGRANGYFVARPEFGRAFRATLGFAY